MTGQGCIMKDADVHFSRAFTSCNQWVTASVAHLDEACSRGGGGVTCAAQQQAALGHLPGEVEQQRRDGGGGVERGEDLRWAGEHRGRQDEQVKGGH